MSSKSLGAEKPAVPYIQPTDWKSSVDLFEYQARDLFESYGVPVLAGITADTPEEAKAAAEKLGGIVVVKAQVKVGGRGKAGGVKVAKTPDEAYEAAEAILGLDIKGHVVQRVMVAAGARIAQEFYFSVLLDRSNRSFLSMASVEGGMEIEILAVEKLARETAPGADTDKLDTQGDSCELLCMISVVLPGHSPVDLSVGGDFLFRIWSDRLGRTGLGLLRPPRSFAAA